ncbi:MAG TPA: response regulator [Nocardioidaceae bacterium]|nr:response regulator [Nocardioidaceae bacterium]
MATPLVLVAEDDPDLCDLLQMTLEHQGAEVVTVSNGTEVVPACRARRPDLLLLDLSLEGRHGIDVLRDLRADEALSSLPVLVVTGHGRESGVDEAMAAGATDWLGKPFTPTDLTLRVTLLLSQVAS